MKFLLFDFTPDSGGWRGGKMDEIGPFEAARFRDGVR